MCSVGVRCTWNIPGIVRTKHGSMLCAVTSVDFPNPCFAPNIYTAGNNIGITSLTCRHCTLSNYIMCSDSYPIPVWSLFLLYHPYIPYYFNSLFSSSRMHDNKTLHTRVPHHYYWQLATRNEYLFQLIAVLYKDHNTHDHRP